MKPITKTLALVFFSLITFPFLTYSQDHKALVRDNSKLYSTSWWTSTIKFLPPTYPLELGFKASNFAFKFDVEFLMLKDMVIDKAPLTYEQAVRKSDDELFADKEQPTLQFGFETSGVFAFCDASSVNCHDCQLICAGRYFQHRFINKIPKLTNCNPTQSGLDIMVWPDRFTLLVRALPTTTLLSNPLVMRYKVPDAYTPMTNASEIKGFKKADGSGYVILKSNNSSSISVTGNVVESRLTGTFSAGSEITNGLVVYPVQDVVKVLSQITSLQVSPVSITVNQISPTPSSITVSYDQVTGSHNVALKIWDGYKYSSKNFLERVSFTISNNKDFAVPVRLDFGKTGSAANGGLIGMVAIIRDAAGIPIGMPIQLSKNWHTNIDERYKGLWYKALLMLTVPPNSTVSLEYASFAGYWGGLPAASHSQLCLVGWGYNQQWDESALGSWCEGICYEPDLDQANSCVLDTRPLFVTNTLNETYKWTNNVGGADFFRLSKTGNGSRSSHSNVRTIYRRYCPNLAEATYMGNFSGGSIKYEYTTMLGRSDDIMRGIYKLKMEVLKDITTPFLDLSILQNASPEYHYTNSSYFAIGNENGLIKSWTAKNTATGAVGVSMTIPGNLTWIAMTGSSVSNPGNGYAADRGIVLRKWKATINGKAELPYWREVDNKGGASPNIKTSIICLTVPPTCTTLKAGDKIEAEIELFTIPMAASHYYGPNANLKTALADSPSAAQDKWDMVYREAKGNNIQVIAKTGTVVSNYPICVKVSNDSAHFSVKGGIGYVPLTIKGISTYQLHNLKQYKDGNWQAVDQSVVGNDFWQTDFDAEKNTWDITYNVNLDNSATESAAQIREFKFGAAAINTSIQPVFNQIEIELECYPNPFFSTSTIQYKLREYSKVVLKVCDVMGKELVELVNAYQAPNTYSIKFDASKLNSGVYFCKLITNKNTMSRKIVLKR